MIKSLIQLRGKPRPKGAGKNSADGRAGQARSSCSPGQPAEFVPDRSGGGSIPVSKRGVGRKDSP